MDMKEILNSLEELENSLDAAELEISIRSNEDETVLSSNYNGLLWLAVQALKLADKKIEGAHIHIGEFSIADEADKPLVIVFKSQSGI